MSDEAYIRQAIELARKSVENGNNPFGALLVIDDEVVRTAENTTVTDDDLAGHPEFRLARWAARDLEPEERTACTMYASTEPCSMCASAIYYAGLGRVVFSVPGRTLFEELGVEGIDIPCEEVIDRGDGRTVVEGPVLESEGIEVHEAFY
jgi:tRNA(Arg) A34 adenosine deaminase TadA